MKLYYYNDGEYTYEDLHNQFGFTTEPMEEIGYKSISPWGILTSDTGYSDNLNSILSNDLFIIGNIGWCSLNDLALNKRLCLTSVDMVLGV